MIKRLVFLVFILLFYHQGSKSQIIGLDLLNYKKSVQIPFEIEQGFIIVHVWLENVVLLKMIFDTGAENTILFDKEIPQILGIKFNKTIAIVGSDLDSVLTAYIARNTRMQLENCARVNRDIIVLAENNLLLKEKLGIHVNGILGGSFFSNLVVKINYQKKRITMYNPQSFKLKGKKYESFDIEVDSNKPYIEAEITNSDNSVTHAKLLLDTGASLPFLIHTNSDSSLLFPDRVMIGNVGFGLSGVVKGFMGRTRNLKIGSFHFENISTSFQDIFTSTLSRHTLLRNGIIGNNLLRRFHVIIDYSREKLYLRAFKKYNRAFDYDRSGLTIFAVGADLNQYYIVSVIKESPASRAGILPGDIITKLGHRKAKNLQLENFSYKLSRKAGKLVKMTIKREDEFLRKEFRLEDWFDIVNNQ